jgi:stage V sporulation protein SpoVS
MKFSAAFVAALLAGVASSHALQLKVDGSDQLVLINNGGTEVQRLAAGTVNQAVAIDGQHLAISFGADAGERLVAVLAPAPRSTMPFSASIVPSERGWILASLESGLTGKLSLDGRTVEAGNRMPLSDSGTLSLKLASDGKATATVAWTRKGSEPVAEGSKRDNKDVKQVAVDNKAMPVPAEGEPVTSVGVPPVYIGNVPDPTSNTYTDDDSFDRTFLVTGKRHEKDCDGGCDDREDTSPSQPRASVD